MVVQSCDQTCVSISPYGIDVLPLPPQPAKIAASGVVTFNACPLHVLTFRTSISKDCTIPTKNFFWTAVCTDVEA